MSKIYWFTVFGVLVATCLQNAVLAIDLSRLYGHYGAPVKRSSRKCTFAFMFFFLKVKLPQKNSQMKNK